MPEREHGGEVGFAQGEPLLMYVAGQFKYARAEVAKEAQHERRQEQLQEAARHNEQGAHGGVAG